MIQKSLYNCITLFNIVTSLIRYYKMQNQIQLLYLAKILVNKKPKIVDWTTD